MSEQVLETEYRCPGETYTISRAVHLARLAGYYAACRDCPRRDDTLGLSARQVRRVAEAHSLPRVTASWHGADGLREVAINDMSPQAARAVAVEFARQVQGPIVFASDGRFSTAAIVAAIVEGIRWTGCEAIDLGAASVPSMAHAIEETQAGGGIYLGNPSGAAHSLGMKFWIGGRKTDVRRTIDDAEFKPELLDRPARTFGPLRREDAAEGYLNELRPAYHALRPLRFVLRCSCEPVISYLNDLLQNVACRFISAEPGSDVGEQVATAKVHFGIEITDDGEDCRVFDEEGRIVVNERISRVLSDAAGEAPEADALRTLTYLLVLLSRDDAPFSAVLDRASGTR